MCGIVGYIGPKDVVPVLIEGLKKLEYRGYDSAGVAVAGPGCIRLCRVQGKVSALEEALRKSPIQGAYGLGHTRWATHGRPSETNAHPHVDCKGEIVVVHNGIIENYLALKSMLKAEGHVFRTETDTEVIAHLIEKHFRGSLEEAVRAALSTMEGAFAIGVFAVKDPGKIVAAKLGPPLVVGVGDGETIVSSDINAILAHTPRVAFLEDREMVVLDEAGPHFMDFQGKPIDKKIEQIQWNPLMIEKKGFKHFMLKEIFEQPQVIRDTLMGRLSLDQGEVLLDETGLPPAVFRDIRKAVIIACGTSSHAGFVGKYLLESLAGIPADVEYASEYRYRDFILEKDALVIIISQSGETADTLAALRAAKGRAAATLAITNAVSSSIAREAQGVLYTHAGPEIGVAATKTFTAQMTALALVALGIAQAKGAGRVQDRMAVIEELQRLPHKIEQILNRVGPIEELAKQFVAFFHFLYLGRWVNFPIALEGALKLKEISYIHAEAYAGGEMKHGPIALIDEKMPTMAIIPKDRVYEKMLSNIAEIKARSGFIIAVADENDAAIRDHVDVVIPIPPTHPLLTPFLSVVPLQLFAYYIAAKRGADIDQPRNLAKSVTVE
ncbi:MAG: glutamine--fructose-6-phosphate transaminase (isomerizing) [Candidatus Aminicenantes bacterium]|nr:glutamine--fructose-6-phosphate transaminase (isomerizing) [Candidatus Aminicenantes bacterium]